MGKFEDQLSRMKSLYTYGTVSENNDRQSNHTIEYHATAADGKSYGIIKECSHYYIKYTTPEKETLAESYQYIGGFNNKKKYEFEGYQPALKYFGEMLGSINEAHDGHVNTESLDPFKKNIVLQENTDKFASELARQRQIMYNASMLMNESNVIGADRKNDTVMYDKENPEAETGKKGDEGMTKTSAKPEYAGSKTKGVNTKAAPFNKTATVKESCENGVCNEDEDWASKGLPSTPGTGEADTDHNNDPFNKTVNEEDEDLDDVDVEDDDDMDDADLDSDVEDAADDVDVDVDSDDMEDEDFSEDDFDADDDSEYTDDDADTDVEGDDDFDVEDGEEDETLEDESDDDLESLSREELIAKIKELQGNSSDVEDEVDADAETDEEPIEDEPMGEPSVDNPFEPSLDDENPDVDSAEDMDADTDDMGSEDEFSEDDFEADDDDETGETDECGMLESKRNFMNQIVESVVRSIIKEDTLHDFGNHPGYRKKPMQLPPTGEDKNEHGEDINDESVHSEEPFGKQIGKGIPFEKAVDAITKDVIAQLKK